MILSLETAELHLHTCYSLLEGASPQGADRRATHHGYDALAITDRNNLYGAMVFARACRDAGIRPIIGVELTVAADPDADPTSIPTATPATSPVPATTSRWPRTARATPTCAGWSAWPTAGAWPTGADRERRRRDPCASLRHGSTPPGSSASPAGAVGSWPGGSWPVIERGRGTCCAAGSTGSDRETCGRATTTWSRATSPASGRRCRWPASWVRGWSPPGTSTTTTRSGTGSTARSAPSATAPRSTAATPTPAQPRFYLEEPGRAGRALRRVARGRGQHPPHRRALRLRPDRGPGYRLPRRTSPGPHPRFVAGRALPAGARRALHAGVARPGTPSPDEELGSSPGTGWPASSSCTTRC